MILLHMGGGGFASFVTIVASRIHPLSVGHVKKYLSLGQLTA
jgi:hypothetical protein